MLKRVAFYLVALIGICVITPTKIFAETKVRIPAGTAILVRVVEKVSPSTHKLGDRARMLVDQDVVISGAVVIARSAPVFVEVATAEEAGYAGTSGKIAFSFKTVTAVDGNNILLSGTKEQKGKDSMVVSIGASIVCCPLFLLMKGEEGVVPENTLVTVYVLQDADVTVK